MPKIIINPSDVEGLKTPLYRKDGNKVYLLYPYTTSDQVRFANGENAEEVVAKLNTDVATAQTTADQAVADASAAQTAANTAQTTANTAKTTANAVKAAIENASTGLAATKEIADAAKAKADTSVQLSGEQTISGVKAFSSSPIIPTPGAADNSTRAATTAFVRAVVSALVNSAPETLDTLKELADALGNDPNFATTVATQIGNVASIANTAKATADAAKTAADNAGAAAVQMTGATNSNNGAMGLVPAPSAGAATRYLRSDGTWQTPPDTDTTYNVATPTTSGLMSAEDKTKLDGLSNSGSGLPESGILLIANGGTGANTAASALSNLGALPKAGGEMTGPVSNLTLAGLDVSAYDASAISAKWAKDKFAQIFTGYKYLYIDAINGSDTADLNEGRGTVGKPFASIEGAFTWAKYHCSGEVLVLNLLSDVEATNLGFRMLGIFMVIVQSADTANIRKFTFKQLLAQQGCVEFKNIKLEFAQGAAIPLLADGLSGTATISIGEGVQMNGAVSGATVKAMRGGKIVAPHPIAGSVIGKRYSIETGGCILVNGRGEDAIPGTIAGTNDAHSFYM